MEGAREERDNSTHSLNCTETTTTTSGLGAKFNKHGGAADPVPLNPNTYSTIKQTEMDSYTVVLFCYLADFFSKGKLDKSRFLSKVSLTREFRRRSSRSRYGLC